MITLFISSIVIFFSYLGFILVKYGIPTSLSESYYLLPKKVNTLFYGFCVLTVFPMLIFWLNLYEGDLQFLPFLSCAGLAFVGAAAAFKQKTTNIVHYVAAGVCGLSSQLWIVLCTNLWPISLIALIMFILIGIKSRGVFNNHLKETEMKDIRTGNAFIFFAEMGLFLSLYIVLLLEWQIKNGLI